MKILKYVTVETEIEVDVSAADIAAVLAEEEPISARQALHAIGNAANVIKAVTPAMIDQMGGPARALISGFLKEQAERFSMPKQ